MEVAGLERSPSESPAQRQQKIRPYLDGLEPLMVELQSPGACPKPSVIVDVQQVGNAAFRSGGLVKDGARPCCGPSPSPPHHSDIPQVCEHSWLPTLLRSKRVSRLVPSFLPALSSRQPPAGTHGQHPSSEADVKVTSWRQGTRRAFGAQKDFPCSYVIRGRGSLTP